jgi:ABC-type sugar transport system ATPase subunit
VGADRADAGTVRVAGRLADIRSPRDAKRHGICLLPEDRKGQGLVLGLSVMHNVTLASLDRLSRFGWMNGGAERALAGGLVRRLDVRTPGLDQLARNLSGGNQQKLVLAKWLAVEPRVLVFDEPTRGIDVGARVEVYRLITRLARQGAAVLLISSDLTEVLGMSHRVGVMRGRRLAGILPRRRATPERVMRLAMGLTSS